MRKLCIGTWNVSECIPCVWDLNSGIDRENNSGYDTIVNTTNEIVRIINDEQLDIVCFQEFPVDTGSTFSVQQTICERTELKHYVQMDTCPSFLFSGGRIGVAVFSKYEIMQYSFNYFDNPNLTVLSKSGNVYKTFDKGIITASFTVDGMNFSIITGHAIAFAPFNATAEEYPESYLPLLSEVKKEVMRKVPVMLIGDFNADNLLTIIPEVQQYVTDKLYGKTTPAAEMEGHFYPDGRKLDYFMTTNEINVIEVKKVENFSDHFFCVCTCLL